MKNVVLCVLGVVVALSVLFYGQGGKEMLTILVGIALPTVPAWVIWQLVKLLKGPSVPVSPEEEKNARVYDPTYDSWPENVWHSSRYSSACDFSPINVWHDLDDD